MKFRYPTCKQCCQDLPSRRFSPPVTSGIACEAFKHSEMQIYIEYWLIKPGTFSYRFREDLFLIKYYISVNGLLNLSISYYINPTHLMTSFGLSA